jgi:multidrug resistance efflux pump
MNKFKLPLRIGLAVPAVLTVTFIFMSCNPIPVEWVVVNKGGARETVLATGRIAGSRVISLALIKSGIVSRTHCNDGDTVHEGDTLVVYDNREEMNRVAQRKNEITIARINLEKLENESVKLAQERYNQTKVLEMAAKRQRNRSDTMYNQGAISQSAFDDVIKEYEVRHSQRIAAEAELNSAKEQEVKLGASRLRQARLLFDEARIALSRTILTAPSSGSVVEVLVNRGEFIAAGAPQILFLPDDSSEVVEVQVDESEIGKVRIGQRARVGAVGDNSTSYNAVVREIVGKINPDRGTGTVILGLISPDTVLLADRTVNAQIIIGESTNTMVIEQRFVVRDNGTTYVYVLRNGKAARQIVKAASIGNGSSIIEEGLNSGDTLVFAPEVADGTPVTLKSR